MLYTLSHVISTLNNTFFSCDNIPLSIILLNPSLAISVKSVVFQELTVVAPHLDILLLF
jgi:hypothetical protein